MNIIRIAADAAANAGASQVTRIRLVIGDLSSIVDDCVLFYFDLLAAGTPVVGAKLDFVRIPAQFACTVCGARFPVEGRDWTCPSCGGRAHIDDRARECYVESVEVEG